MEPIRLLRWQGRGFSADEFHVKTEEPTPEQRRLWRCEEYAALTRAEYDALAAEAADARTLRAERDSLVAERDALREAVATKERAHGLSIDREFRLQDERDAATTRADAADERAKDAEALLEESAQSISVDYLFDEATTKDDPRVGLLDRIDTFLGKPAGPTPDDRPTEPDESDRRGEDGA